jgi:hypothetical protein
MSTPADNVPLRLRDAAKFAFPMGGVAALLSAPGAENTSAGG